MTKYSSYEIAESLETFTRGSLRSAINNNQVRISESTLTRLLNQMIQNRMIQRTSKGYQVILSQKKCSYQYAPSGRLLKIQKQIGEIYPNIEYEVWEYIQLNEFINHLVGRNAFFIETGKDYESAVFELLNQHYPRVLLNPSYSTFSLYSNDEPIVVKRLISRTPENPIQSCQPSLEKLLVDLMKDSFTSKLISHDDLKRMLAQCEETYFIDHKRMIAYAKRRNAQDELKIYIPE